MEYARAAMRQGLKIDEFAGRLSFFFGIGMEAMKMENILRAPKAATVKATPVKAGESVAVDQVIVEFE